MGCTTPALRQHRHRRARHGTHPALQAPAHHEEAHNHGGRWWQENTEDALTGATVLIETQCHEQRRGYLTAVLNILTFATLYYKKDKRYQKTV